MGGTMSDRNSDAWPLSAGLAALAVVTWTYLRWLAVSNAAVVSTTFLLVVLIVATVSRFRVAAAVSIVAMVLFNYFFLPPVGTLTIADPQNWVALLAFLAVSLVASNLSAVARTRTREAVSRRDELARLFDLGRDVLVMSDSRGAISMLARSVARRFDLAFVAIALPRSTEWDVFAAGAQTIALDTHALTRTFAAAQASLEFDANARTYTGHSEVAAGDRTVRLVPLRVGTRPIGLLAAAGRPVEAGTLDALAGVVAIAIERAQFLEERKTGELTRQREELKTALLSSLGHDLRTPLAAIRVAASNIKSPELAPEERLDQSDLILAEVERLTRLFENVHEMARIDAGGDRHRDPVGAPVRDRRGGARPGGAHAAGPPRRGEDRARSPGPARPAADRGGDRAPPRERRAVHAALVDHHDRRAARRGGPHDRGDRRRAGHRAGGPAARLRAVLPRRQRKVARVGDGHGPVDRAGAAGRPARPHLGRERTGRRRAVHDRGSGPGAGHRGRRRSRP